MQRIQERKKGRKQERKKARKQESKIGIEETACGHLGYGAVRMFRIKFESAGTLPVSNLIQLFVEGDSGDQIASRPYVSESTSYAMVCS